MVWKVLFVLSLLVLAAVFAGETAFIGTIHLTGASVMIGYFFAFLSAVTAGWFYSLGWQKRLYSEKANKIFMILLLVFVCACTYQSVVGGLPGLLFELKSHNINNQSDTALYITALTMLLIVSIVIYTLIWLPAFCAYWNYKKRFHEFETVENTCVKIFSVYMLLMSVVANLYFLFSNYRNGFNVVDYICILSVLVDAMFLIGYSFKIKFSRQILWKILFLPYIVLTFGSSFFLSEDYKAVSGMNLLPYNYSLLVAFIFVNLIYICIFYRYAFTSDVYKLEQKSD